MKRIESTCQAAQPIWSDLTWPMPNRQHCPAGGFYVLPSTNSCKKYLPPCSKVLLKEFAIIFKILSLRCVFEILNITWVLACRQKNTITLLLTSSEMDLGWALDGYVKILCFSSIWFIFGLTSIFCDIFKQVQDS